MTTTLSVLWITPDAGATSHPPDIHVVASADPGAVDRALRTTDAERIHLHDGTTPPSAELLRSHRHATGLGVTHGPGVPLDAARPPADVWIALRGGRGVSAPATVWRAALDDRSLPRCDDAGGAVALAASLTGAAPVEWIDHPLEEAQAAAVGEAAVLAYRRDPSTLPHTGLTSFREVSAGAFNRRRLLRRLPAPVRGSRGVSPANADAAFWDGVEARSTQDEWRAITGRVPFLMYHGFGRDEPASRYVIPEARFRRQLRILSILRRRVISLDEYVEARAHHRLIDPRSVVLTIDDGYQDAFDVAEPLLAARNMTATLFVPSERVGSDNHWSSDGPLVGRPVASADRLRRAGAIRIGSHAQTHPSLPDLDDAAVRGELVGSRDDLEAILGQPVDTFAYPYGDEDERVRRGVREAGYAAAVSSRGGKNLPAERLDTLRRIEIRGDDPLWRFPLAVLFGSARPVRTFWRGFRR